MAILDQLNEDLKQAMRDKDKVRLSVIRMVKSAAKNREIELGRALTDEDALAVIQKEIKQRRDSLQAFQEAKRTDLIEQAEQEIAVLESYLPAQLGDDEIEQLVKDVMARVGAAGKADMGKVMRELMPEVRGRADGRRVQQIVERLLA
ncbi:MAG: GatB/YqeY domain-containing protein [Alicyclobacillus mali]|uniref:GatB/YqeY domain-containing protein n=1 Tax=Alicyclobacillus mali (ex Roth et al. 2021) TaxID=1123961 RepID=UPI0023F44258|nr:GatB/YqeY domain-containing protein [Alicyclobacillus mali (ex Roth et al. 2021)]MCL6487841.1 GatB/YqeY domain-containing protein [Alicyclobacillus mali (ex Roth et al. 2021)]